MYTTCFTSFYSVNIDRVKTCKCKTLALLYILPVLQVFTRNIYRVKTYKTLALLYLYYLFYTYKFLVCEHFGIPNMCTAT